jgi:isochorismate hydrolase
MSTRNDIATLCDTNDSQLVIMDIQTHLTATMPAKVLARLQRNTGLLLNAAGLLGVPVYATEQYPKGLGNTEPDIVELLPESTRRYEKTTFSCAGAGDFLTDLKESGRNQIVLTGMEAHICILQSAIDLLNAGYQVFVAADGVCSRHRESYETALLRLRQTGVIICDAESILFEWLKDSKNEHFKAVQALLK